MPANTSTSTTENKAPADQAILLAADLCRVFEGFRSKPYLCPAGVWTIGYGSTLYPNKKKVSLNDSPVTKEQAEQYLQDDLLLLAQNLRLLSPVLVRHPARFAAIIDFAYNLGTGRYRASTLRRRVDAGDWEAAKVELRKWNKGGGKILPGLVKRRAAEATLLTVSV